MNEPTEHDLDSWASDVEDVMSGCALAQPVDAGEAIWMNGHGSLEDALELAGVPEEHWEAVAPRISCPTCGDSHELWEEVGLKFEQEIRFDELRAAWIVEHQHRLDDFCTHLENYPYLGLGHELGREINDTIKSLPTRIISGSTWYRARGEKDGWTPTAEDFGLPDTEKIVVGEGRFNHHGKPVVYMAETEGCAVAEVIKSDETRAWVMSHFIKEEGSILDLSMQDSWADKGLSVLAVGLTYSGNLSEFVKREKGWKPEYLLPRFIADCARLNGFAGLIFRSSRYPADNLVLFEWDAKNIAPQNSPEIVERRVWSGLENKAEQRSSLITFDVGDEEPETL